MNFPWHSLLTLRVGRTAAASSLGAGDPGSRVEAWLLVIPLVMMIVLTLKAFGVPAPIYAGDEYAYWRNGTMMRDREALYEADPAMQRIDNKIYCLLISTTNWLAPDNVLLPCLLNTAAWAGIIALVYRTAAMLMPRRDAAVAAALTSIMPIGLTAGTLMADVPLGLGYWLILSMLVHRSTAPLYWGEAAAVCGLSAVLLGVKPHAIVLPAAYVLASLLRTTGSWRSDLRATLRRCGIGIAAGAVAFGVVHAGIEGLVAEQSAATAGLGGIYNNILERSAAPSFLRDNLLAIVQILAHHAGTLCLFLSLPLVSLASKCGGVVAGGSRRPDAEDNRLLSYACFVLCSMVLLVMMTAVFSALTHATDRLGENRLHERYYWYLIPAILVGGLAIRHHAGASPHMTRIAAAMTCFALLAHVLAVRGTCRLYPWDSPDFYALYAVPNTYWGQPMVVRFTDRVVLGAVGLVALAGIVRPRLMWPCSLAALGVTFAIGWLGVLDWQRETSRNHTARLTETRSLATGIGGDRIQAIGTGRFGPFAANLFGLAGNPLVTARTGPVIQPSDIKPQAQAVFVEGQHEFRAPYAWKIGGRWGTMYALVDRGMFGVARGTGTMPDKPSTFTYRLGDSVKNVSLFGFNPPEPWGAWTAISPGEIVLPDRVAGRTRVTWKGFVATEHADMDVVLRIGGARIVQRMTDKPATYVGECDVREATDRVLVESTIFQPHPWSASLGVGLMELTLEVLPDVP